MYTSKKYQKIDYIKHPNEYISAGTPVHELCPYWKLLLSLHH